MGFFSFIIHVENVYTKVVTKWYTKVVTYQSVSKIIHDWIRTSVMFTGWLRGLDKSFLEYYHRGLSAYRVWLLDYSDVWCWVNKLILIDRVIYFTNKTQLFGISRVFQKISSDK